MTNRYSRLAYIVIGLGFLLRLIYVIWINPLNQLVYSDMSNYIYISDLIFKNDWRVTHFFQPIGYPYILLAVKSLASNWLNLLQWIQLISSTLTMWLVWKVSKESFGEKIGLASLVVAAIHLPWITFTGLILSENIFIFFLSLLAWLSLKLIKEKNKKYALLWSLTFFGAFLIKGTHVFLAPLMILGIFLFQKKKSFPYLAVIAFTIASGLLAHGLFTKSKIGTFQMSASAGGLNFVEGKCPHKNNADSAGYSWLSPLYFQLGLTAQKKWPVPFTNSRFYFNEGLKCIGKNPYVLIQSLESIPYLFIGNSLWPANYTRIAAQVRLYELIFALFSIVGLLVYLRFLRFDPHKEEQILVWVLPILSVFICVYIFKSEIRFRIPFDVWIIPLSLKGWSELLKARLA